jgi:hypothetical protein
MGSVTLKNQCGHGTIIASVFFVILLIVDPQRKYTTFAIKSCYDCNLQQILARKKNPKNQFFRDRHREAASQHDITNK